VKPVVEVQRFGSGFKLQGRLKPEMGAGSLTGTSGPNSGIIAGMDNPLWWSKRECAPGNGRKSCEAGNGEEAR